MKEGKLLTYQQGTFLIKFLIKWKTVAYPEGGFRGLGPQVTKGAPKKEEKGKEKERKRGKEREKKKEKDKSTWQIGCHSSTSRCALEEQKRRLLELP